MKRTSKLLNNARALASDRRGGVRLGGPVLALAIVLTAGIGGLYAVSVQLGSTDTSGETGQILETAISTIETPVALLVMVVFGLAAVAFVLSVMGRLVSSGGMTGGGGR